MRFRRGFRIVAVAGAVVVALFQPVAPATSAPVSRLRVVFDPAPADAKAGEALTSVAFEPAGAPVVLKVLDGSRVANVRETFTISAVLGTASTALATVTTDGGVAALSLTAPAPGQSYHLLADGEDVDGTSSPFDVYQEAERCRDDGDATCVVEGEKPAKLKVSVSANTTVGALALNISDVLPFGTCGVSGPDDPEAEHHAPGLVVQDEANIGVSKLAVMTIAKEIVMQRSDNGASFYEVCFSKDGVSFANLPGCPPARKRTTACVVSKTKTGSGAVEIVIFLPKGDPTWW